MLCTVPEFSIIPLTQPVPESAGEIKICITTNSSLAREIKVTTKPSLIEGSHTNPAKGMVLAILLKHAAGKFMAIYIAIARLNYAPSVVPNNFNVIQILR